jgi:hypothetical protein
MFAVCVYKFAMYVITGPPWKTSQGLKGHPVYIFRFTLRYFTCSNPDTAPLPPSKRLHIEEGESTVPSSEEESQADSLQDGTGIPKVMRDVFAVFMCSSHVLGSIIFQQFHLLKRWTQMKVWINWTSSGGTQLLSQLTTSRSQLSHFIRQLLLILKSVTVRMSGRSVVDIRLVAGVSCWLETNNTQWTWLK